MHADKTEYLVRFHGREESVKNTNVARNQRMSTDSSPELEHTAWQDGGAVLFLLKAPHVHALLSAFWPRAMSMAQDR